LQDQGLFSTGQAALLRLATVRGIEIEQYVITHQREPVEKQQLHI
jgi:hypothetical protein